MATKEVKQALTLVDALMEVVECKLDDGGCKVSDIYFRAILGKDKENDDAYFQMIRDWAKKCMSEKEQGKIINMIRTVYESDF